MPLSLAGKTAAVVLALGSVGAYALAPPDARGQIVFLERLALRLDHARVIAPDTAMRINELTARARAQHAHSGDLAPRREQAIVRIENALQAKMSVGAAADAQSLAHR